MAESLTDAINSSMIKDFSYNRVDTADVKKSMYNMQQETLKNKVKIKPSQKPVKKNDAKQSETKKEKTEEQQQLDDDQLILVKKMAKDLKSDIVIYGNYLYDDKTNEIVFTVSLYLVLSDSVKELDETRNVVDNTIFKATQKVSKNLVTEIHNMIEEAERLANERAGKKETAEPKKDEKQTKVKEKVALTKKVAMATALDWSSKKFSIGLMPGFLINDISAKNCSVCETPLNLAARFWIIPNVYLGANLSAGWINAKTIPLISGAPEWTSFTGLAFAGYSIPAGRWLFSADIGGGYYLILDNAKNLMFNPIYGARLGVEVLLADFLSIGLSGNAHMYYDSPKPVYMYGLLFSINFVM